MKSVAQKYANMIFECMCLYLNTLYSYAFRHVHIHYHKHISQKWHRCAFGICHPKTLGPLLTRDLCIEGLVLMYPKSAG